MPGKQSLQAAGWNLDCSYARLPSVFFTCQPPDQVRSPQLIIFNHCLADHLGLDADTLQCAEGVAALAGNVIMPGALPLAQAYAGHQFGNFTMLGDGRAILLGEQITPTGQRFDIQLKGAGRTPYSRGGDGRAALGPMLREYLISEAMHGLGIATTRSLAVTATGQPVVRQTELAGAVLTRVAASHLRVGTFQYAAHWASVEELGALTDYALARHFPACQTAGNSALALLEQVIERQAELIADWQLVGFVHGVMNTDNMTISGETIDYGPCAFIDVYDPATVFSSIDVRGRYAYGNQPAMAAWNLARFAEALLPLLHDDDEQAIGLAQAALLRFETLYYDRWLRGMRAKLGLFNQEAQDEGLIHDLLALMQQQHVDYTNAFRTLTLAELAGSQLDGVPGFADWHERWQARSKRQPQSGDDQSALMRRRNPAVIARNHRVEAAIEQAVNNHDYSLIKQLLAILADPYAYSSAQQAYAAPPTESNEPYRTFCGT